MTVEMLRAHRVLYRRQGGQCATCGARLGLFEGELAHRVPQTKGNIRKYGKAVIHHVDNLALVCRGSDRCNSGADIRNHPVAVRELVAIIESQLPTEEE